ncbi:MAG: cytochrome-c peroxidase [Magnetospirillum sp.]
MGSHHHTPYRRLGIATAVLILTVALSLHSTSAQQEPLRPLKAPPDLAATEVALGRELFHDPMLSRDGSVSCASCHPLSQGGSDNLKVSIGIGGAKGSVNAPTVFNTIFNIAQFWDGRATTLEQQVDGPLQNPVEMDANWPDIIGRLRASSYEGRFQQVYGAPPSPQLVRRAMANFERSLVTVQSRFDRWLGGQDGALDAEEKKGYALFKSYGCASCHQGTNVGGNLFQKLGFFGNWFKDRGGPVTQADLGRFNVTGRPADKHVFKVPSLRLVVLTPPYFHDGSVTSLADAIRVMGRYQLGRDIPDADIALIARFLASLTPETLPATP